MRELFIFDVSEIFDFQALSDTFIGAILTVNGAWPSGKAPGFGPGIRGFESLRPSHPFRTSPSACTQSMSGAPAIQSSML